MTDLTKVFTQSAARERLVKRRDKVVAKIAELHSEITMYDKMILVIDDHHGAQHSVTGHDTVEHVSPLAKAE